MRAKYSSWNSLFPGSAISFAIWILTTSNSYSQDSRFRHYTVDDGLPSSTVYKMIQDQKGFVWMGTKAGLCRFDGYEFRTYTNKNGLPDNDVLDLFPGKDGKIWVSTFKRSACYFYDDSIYGFEPTKEFKDFQFHEMITDRAGTLWFASLDNGLVQLTNGITTGYTFDSFPSDYVWIDEDSSGKLWIGTRKEFGFYENGAFKLFELNDSIWKRGGMIRILATKNGRVYGSSLSHVFEIEDSAYKVIFPNNYVEGVPRIMTVEEDRQGNLLIATNRGAFRLITSNFHHYTETIVNGLVVHHLLEDSEGNLWMSTPESGIYFLSKNAQRTSVYENQDQAKLKLTALCRNSKNGELFFASADGMLFSMNSQGITNQKNLNLENQPGRIYDIAIDAENTVWVSGNHGLYIGKGDFFKKEIRSFKIAERAPPELIYYNHIDSKYDYLQLPAAKKIFPGKNNLWITKAGGFFELHQQDSSYVLGELVHKRATSVCEDRNGKIWIGCVDGLYYLEAANGKYAIMKSFFLNDMGINEMVVDSENNLWIGTDGYGVFLLTDSVLNNITTEDGLINNIVTALYANGSEVWVGTNGGVSELTVLNWNPLSYHMVSLDKSDGLISNEVNDLVVSNDTLYAATNNGLVIMNTSRINEKYSMPLYITDIRVNDRDTAVCSFYQLPYFKNNINISYVGLSFKSDKKISYRYKMFGVDTSWSYTQFTKVQYPTLPPGSYTFYLDAHPSHGEWSGQPAVVRFTILPPFWKTVTFVTVSIILGIAFISLIIYLNTQRIRRREEEKNAVKRQIADFKMKALHAQMNPHFISNALNSIRHYISMNDSDVAEKYLAKFSRLVRFILESSRAETILLSDELQAIRIYLELESLRFNGKVNYQIDVAPDINPNDVEIPSLIIQPFIENAVIHGLAPKTTGGKITVKFKRNGQKLKCEIIDDGVGRSDAPQFKGFEFLNHKSRSMSIINEKLDIIRQTQGKEIKVDIIDLKSQSNMEGTKINIEFTV